MINKQFHDQQLLMRTSRNYRVYLILNIYNYLNEDFWRLTKKLLYTEKQDMITQLFRKRGNENSNSRWRISTYFALFPKL